MCSFQSKLHNFFKTRKKKNSTKAAMDTKSYDDFEPFCNWTREEGAETLVLHLPEFKKEQLKVHVNSLGTLKITGERPLDRTRWSRFSKEIKIPNKCNSDEIHAKFAAARLYIVMPIKKITNPDQPKPLQNSQQNVSKTTETNQPQVSKKPTLNSEKLGGFSQTMENKAAENGMERSVTRVRLGRKVAINVAVVLLPVVLALGAYIVYRYTTSDHHPLDV
ncbi:inactive protein RESTRICTED TEV MOVEMENT 2-like [Cornus florida]|uniref:inactive protein RESTRICTED TEV MOVEMENT 2-like n=1 Tax=Cornus florida TaxID=4283 RepID=UPI00289D2447|nr:inactive protein RESTRICTED TEV MOVEMENT 2-like [Cornus florida]